MHDMGGMDGFGAVVTADGELTSHETWEVRAQALAVVGLGGARRWIEQIDPATYLASSYYTRWLIAAEKASLARGMVTADELAERREHFAGDESRVPAAVVDPARRASLEHIIANGVRMAAAVAPRFRVGDAIIVRRMHEPAHNRCPRYVRGARGRIERICGRDRVPSAPTADVTSPVYTVEFASTDLWGDAREPEFAVFVDLWEDYLEPVQGGGP